MSFHRTSFQPLQTTPPQEGFVVPLHARTLRLTLPAPERLFILLALMISGTVTVPQVIELGGISGLGFWTIAMAAFSWGLWFMKPLTPRPILPLLLPLTAFTAVAAISPLWGRGFDTNAIQLLAVTVGFLGLIVLTAREAGQRPAFMQAVANTLDFASVTAAVAYTLTVLAFGVGGEFMLGGRPVFLARPFALFAIIAVARQLARFHAGQRAGLVIAIWLTALVTLSQSRLGMVTILAMYPLSFALLGGKRNILLAVVMLVGGAVVLAGVLMASEEMYKRFFGYDASLEVGGVAINASGRTAAWTAMLADINTPMIFWFGQGAGAGSYFCQTRFENLPHPHNDYIRYLFDFGFFGLLWFLAAMVVAVVMLRNRLRAAIRMNDRFSVALYLTTLMALVGVGVSMFTDNSANYAFVMAPLAVLLGVSLCRSTPGTQKPNPINLDWVFAPERTRLSPEAVNVAHK